MMNTTKMTGKRRSDMDPPLNIGKRIKVQAQRKFAQGAAVLPLQQQKEFSSSGDGFKESPKQTAFEIQTENKASTEDFLTYVCFKGSPSYNMVEPHLVSSYSRKTSVEDQSDSAEPKTLTTSMGDVQGFVPFGVRKQASQHPVKSTVLMEAIKNSKKDLRKKAKPSKLSKNNLEATKQMQTRSSKIVKMAKTRSNVQASNLPVHNGVTKVLNKTVLPKVVKQASKKLEDNMMNKEVSLRARVIRFNNKLGTKKSLNKSNSTVENIYPEKESNKDSATPPKSQSKVEEKSCRFTRNMIKNLKDTPKNLKLALQTRSSALNKKIKATLFKSSAAAKEKAAPSKDTKIKEVQKTTDFSSDDDEPLLKKSDSEKIESEDKLKVKPVNTLVSQRVTRSKQNLCNDKQKPSTSGSAAPQRRNSQRIVENSWIEKENDGTMDAIMTWDEFLEAKEKENSNIRTENPTPPVPSKSTGKAKNSNDRKRKFPFIDPSIANTEASLMKTKRFAKSISTTDLDQQVIEESIKNMLRETTGSKVKQNTDSKLEKSFSESDEEPLAAKIQEASVKTPVTDKSQNNATPTTTTTTKKPTTDLSAIANNITKKIIDSQQQKANANIQKPNNDNQKPNNDNQKASNDIPKTTNDVQTIVESTTVNQTTDSSQVEQRRPSTRRNLTPLFEMDKMADPRLKGRIIPLTVAALHRESTRYNISRRVFKNREYIENWLDNCAKENIDLKQEDYIEPDIIEPNVEESHVSNVFSFAFDNTMRVPSNDNTVRIPPIDNTARIHPIDNTARIHPIDNTVRLPPFDNTVRLPSIDNTVRIPPINPARPFSNMVAEIDSRLERNTYGAMSQLCMNSNSRVFDVTPYPEPERRPVNEVLNIHIPDNTIDVNIYDFESDSEVVMPPRMVKEEWKSKQPKEQQMEMKGFLPFNTTKKNAETEEPQPSEIQTTSENISTTVEIHHVDHSRQFNQVPAVSNNPVEPSAGRSNEVHVEHTGNTEGHLFYLPIHGVTKDGKSVDHVIEGVAVKKDTNGPGGQKEKFIMRAKLVMKSDVDNKKLHNKNTDTQLANMPDSSFKHIEQKHLNQPAGKKIIPTASVPPLTTKNMKTASKSSTCQSPVNNPQSASTKPVATNTRATLAVQGTSSRNTKSSKNNYQINNGTFPQSDDPTRMVNAPVFHPSEKEFQDPLEYIEKITPMAAKYGLCRIVPPASFKSECKISDDMRFTPHNQYLHRMFFRWGNSSRELCAIKKYLATQNVSFKQPPSLCGIEVDLPKMYHVVQNMGGLKKVLENKLWLKVAEEMCLPTNGHIDSRLDDIYCKYLLPYDTLSNAERQKLFATVDKQWEKRQNEMIARASNPLNSPPETEQDDQEHDMTEDVEECITRGKSQTLSAYTRTAKHTMNMQFGKDTEPRPDEVEAKFWDYVTNRKNHICVSTGSIDSSVWGYGFPNAKIKNSPLSKHPWNLKVLTNNSGSVLRSLGPIMGVTVPTLHVGMVFSTCCWYRDPHGLPWVEYLHEGAPKIWYGVPDSQSQKFREALTSLVPGYCQQKTIWLLSDTTMVPPTVLMEHGVSLCRTVQNPGEFILVFPKAFTSSICTGFNVSESVYFATTNWLETACQDFMDIRNSCEPSMFSLEKLIVAISEDARSPYDVLKQILPMLDKIVQNEKQNREAIYNIGINQTEKSQSPFSAKKKARKYQEEGEECHHCRTNLSLSMVYNPEDRGVYCLIHGVEYLKANPNQVANSKLIYTHTTTELDKILHRLMERITLRSTNKKNIKAK